MAAYIRCVRRKYSGSLAVFIILAIIWIDSRVLEKPYRSLITGVVPREGSVETRSGTERKTVKVLILAYFRSGSTFTSQTLSHLNDSFFVFEPLHTTYEFLLESHRSLTFLNGTSRLALRRGFEGSYVVEIIKSVLSCNFENIDSATMTLGFLPIHTWQIKAYVDCLFNKTGHKDVGVCMRTVKKSCRTAPVRVIKTIRLSMQTVPDILSAMPDVKVIHLIRDPRGQFASGNRHGAKHRRFYKQFVCNKVTEDIKIRQELEKKYPNSFLEVIYEDLAQHPLHAVQRMYNFLGLSLPDYLIKWVQEATSSQNGSDKGFLGTRRSNSTLTAYKWITYLSWDYINYFQQRCSWLLTYGQFPFFGSNRDIIGFEIPHRNPPE